jgi:tRNA(Arg) A34 adenosine deaminase TadA
VDKRDEEHLLRAIDVAREARANGNHPFGAILVHSSGEVVLEAQNTVVTERECTGHAETNLMRLASRRFDPEYLAECTLYASTEPCPMCTGAIYWGNVSRVVYALDIPGLDELLGIVPTNRTPHLRAQDVLSAENHPAVVEGPALLEQAREVHEGFWNQPI